jgi:cysteine-rich repeat protein
MLGLGVLVATALALTTLSGSCLGTGTTVCERTGLRCEAGKVCTVDQDGCTDPGGCGDGIKIDDEICDDGNVRDGDGCSADCTSDESCGNGIKDAAAGEACDDGNQQGGDGCSADCRSMEGCGNGVIDVGEQCDTLGESSGCNADCTFAKCGDGKPNTTAMEECDTSGVDTASCNGRTCTTSRCGDGVYNPIAGEECDTKGDTKACDSDCTIPVCGDGHLNMMYVIIERPNGSHHEACDTGGNTQECNSNDNASGIGNCEVPSCGDGYFNPAFTPLGGSPEQCDDGNANDDGRPDACRKNCQKAHCGDNVKDSGEDCDPPGSTCGGGKQCNAMCHCP